MFVQVIEGRVADQEGLRRQIEKWMTDLRPGADGWLGSTAGFTKDGSFVGVIRFESEEAARANGERPEQGAWWAETEKTIDGEATFINCPEVDTFGAGGSDDAGFVQVMIGRADRSEVTRTAEEVEETLKKIRPDVIGGTVAWPGDGRFVQTIYFTSEDEARKAESSEPSAEDREAMERLGSLMKVERYLDIADPWLHSR